MKYIAFILLLLINEINGQNIGMVESEIDVIEFLKENKMTTERVQLAKEGELFIDSTDQRLADSLGLKNWQLYEINQDGIKDLLVFLRHQPIEGRLLDFMKFPIACLILSTPEGKPKIHIFNKDVFAPEALFPDIKRINDELIVFLHLSGAPWNERISGKIVWTDTLCYKFGGFIECNTNTNRYKIKSLSYVFEPGTTGGGFVLKLDEDGMLETSNFGLMGDYYQGNIRDIKQKKVNPEKLMQIEEIINYIDLDDIQEEYSVNWTDDATGNIEATLIDDNGNERTLEVKDYGLKGSFALGLLHGKIRSLAYER